MNILILAFIVLIVAALVCWLIQSAPMISPNFKWALQAIAILIAVLVILHRAGLASL